MIKFFHIVDTDNFNGDYPDEKFLTKTDEKGNTYILNFERKEYAQSVADALNIYLGKHACRFYKVVEEGYKLQGAFEP